MISMIQKFLDLAGKRKKQLCLAWLFQALTSICEGAIYFTLFLVLRDILNGSFTRESLLRYSPYFPDLYCPAFRFLLFYDCKTASGILCHDAG